MDYASTCVLQDACGGTMKLKIAIHTLIAVSLTLIAIGLLYPVNTGAVSLLFILANCVAAVITFVVFKLWSGLSNE
jgi:hypothetical protein